MLTTIYLVVLLLMAVVTIITIILIGAGAAAIFLVKAPYAPTPTKQLPVILELFNLKPGQKLYDLGCGDGRLILTAAKAGIIATGFELSIWAFTKAWVKKLLSNSPVKIYFKNFYQVNLSDANAVFCFLIDKVMAKVENKLNQELKPGTKVICYGFPLPTWQPEKIIDTNPAKSTSSKIYLYIKK